MSKDNGGPAFPSMDGLQEGNRGIAIGEYQYAGGYKAVGSSGMTLRDYFAAKAMPLAWRVFDEGYSPDSPDPDRVAECAYQYADAMLAERAK